MRLRLKIHPLPPAEPTEQHTLKECLGNLARARKHVSYALTVSIAEADPEPSDEDRTYINAHFKLLGIVMALTNDIEAVLHGK